MSHIIIFKRKKGIRIDYSRLGNIFNLTQDVRKSFTQLCLSTLIKYYHTLIEKYIESGKFWRKPRVKLYGACDSSEYYFFEEKNG